MSPPTQAADTSGDFENVLERFEDAWQNGAPRLEDHLASAGTALPVADRHRLLAKLIKIDLDYRWRCKPTGCDPLALEDYVAQFPELGPLEQLPADLIRAEYWVRHCWGDRPAADEFLKRFGARADYLRDVLAQIGADLSLATAGRGNGAAFTAPVPAIPVATPVAPPVDSVAAFLEALRALPLLKPAMLAEVIQEDSHGRFAGPRDLARFLLDRNLLTAYQVNRVMTGHGAALVVEKYVILDRLGEGATGQVFKARHLLMDRLAAVKLIRPELLADADVVQRFYREIEAAGRLSHSNIVAAYDAGPAGPTHFFAMEYVEGTDLNRLVKHAGPLPVDQACDYIRQAACGLAHAHERGLVHRDVKPANLVVASGKGLGASSGVARGKGLGASEDKTNDFSQANSHQPLTTPELATGHQPLATLKILDLGLARVHQAMMESRFNRGLTAEGTILGTPDYMAPEQADNAQAVDVRADIYSLGCTLYYLLSGQPPFAGGTIFQKLARLLQAEPPPLESLCPNVPAGLAQVVRRMMAKRPEDRFQTAAEIAEVLSATGSVAFTDSLTEQLPSALPVSLTFPEQPTDVDATSVTALQALPVPSPREQDGISHSAVAGGTRRGARKTNWGRALLVAGAGLVLLASVLLVVLAGRPRSPEARPSARAPAPDSGKTVRKGSLTGSVNAAAGNYNLTILGTADWVHWGRRGGELPKGQFHFDRMANGGNQISNVTLLGSAEVGSFYAEVRSVSWSNGTPTAMLNDDTGFIWSAASVAKSGPTGFQFTAPADTTPRSLHVYAGGLNVTSRLTAHLSDGSAPDYIVSRLCGTAGAGTYTYLHTITYNAASAGQTLTITYVKTTEVDPHDSIDLIAAWLQVNASSVTSQKQRP